MGWPIMTLLVRLYTDVVLFVHVCGGVPIAYKDSKYSIFKL